MRAGLLYRYFGRFHIAVSVLLLVPVAIGFGLDERPLLFAFLGPAGATLLFAIALLLRARRTKDPFEDGLRRREGFFLVSLSWLLMILYGALPYFFSLALPNFADALFESASGFTTTGATVLWTNPATHSHDGPLLIEDLPPALLFWRSFSHWIGGMGIIVLSVAILPELAIGGLQLFSAESSGLEVDRLAPRIRKTAKRLWLLYAGLTLAEVLCLLPVMSPFDAINHSFATLATGGFSTKNGSIADFQSGYVECVLIAFMFLAGMNFALQYRALCQRQLSRLLASTEVRLYTALTVLATLVVTLNLRLTGEISSTIEALRAAAFQVVSILTTTGFGTEDFAVWPLLSVVIIVILMVIGGCAGSTAGGLKVVRVAILLKQAGREFHRLLHPRLVRPVRIDERTISDEVLGSVLGFVLLYAVAFAGTLLLLAVLPHEREMDLETAASAALSALNSIGPGLGAVGPAENYAFVHDAGKVALAFCMVLGRLEIYTLLIIFLPRFWTRR